VNELLRRSAVVALLLGSLVGFVSYVRSVHGTTRYDPPITEDEARRLRELPMDQAEAVVASRRRIITRQQWVVGSMGYSFFWKGVAENSLVPIIGVFVACMILGKLQTRSGGMP
jgi:hypothetical protein